MVASTLELVISLDLVLMAGYTKIFPLEEMDHLLISIFIGKLKNSAFI